MQGEAEGSFTKRVRIPPRGGTEDSVELNAGARPAAARPSSTQHAAMDESVQ